MYTIEYTNPYAFDYQDYDNQWKTVDIKDPDKWSKINMENDKERNKIEVAIIRKIGTVATNCLFRITTYDSVKYYWYASKMVECSELWMPYIISNSSVSVKPKKLTRIQIDVFPEEEMRMLRREWHRANQPHVFELISKRLLWAYDPVYNTTA